jgi:hypothetical protein
MQAGELLQRLVVQLQSGFSLQRIEEQPTAHTDPPVDPPHRQRDAAR